MPDPAVYDAIIIGGGPSGATAALVLARAGMRAVIIEKTAFPRFHIGESLLPRNYPLIQELGLEDAIRDVPSSPKLGAEFAMGHGQDEMAFTFDQGLLPGSPTLNVERAPFDAALLAEARKAGAEVREETTVRRILRLDDNDVVIGLDDSEIQGRWLFDASGQAAVVARHLGTRRGYQQKEFQKVAYFAHFEHVDRSAPPHDGSPRIVMSDEGWFWLIPLGPDRMSIGLVIDSDIARAAGIPANRMLAWGIARCPALRERMTRASGPDTNQVIANFSYACRPFAGPGYFLLGDAAAFLDPIFSSGVCLGMMSGRHAAEHLIAITRGTRSPKQARREYIRFMEQTAGIFFRLISEFYDHSFRELFLNGTGPAQVHRAVLSVLAGQVFPKPAWCLRWRLRLFTLFRRLNHWLPLVPRRQRFSLLAQTPAPLAEPAAV